MKKTGAYIELKMDFKVMKSILDLKKNAKQYLKHSKRLDIKQIKAKNMKIYKNIKELEADIKDDVLVVDDDVTFEFSFSISASLKIAGDINARNITAGNITAWNITAWDINAWDINAWNINAWDINAWNINARNINAGNILYYAFCCVYELIKCISIKAKREKHQEPICLDRKLEFKTEGKVGKKVRVKLSGGEVIEGELV